MPNDPTVTQALQALADAVEVSLADVEQIHRLLGESGVLSRDLMLREMRWFYGELGLGAHYFQTTPKTLIARHIQSLYAAKVLARSSGERIDLKLESETEEMAIYAVREEHDLAATIERRIEQKFPGHRIQSYHSLGSADPDDPSSQIRLYFVMPPDYVDGAVAEEETALERVAARTFLERAKRSTKARYQPLIEQAARTLGLVISFHDRPELNVKQIVLAFRRNSTHSYFSAVSDVLQIYGLNSRRKYVEQFANGVTIYSIHLDAPVDQQVLDQIREDLSLIYVLPRTALTPLFQQRLLNAQEVCWAYAAWKFAHQFLTRYSREYQRLVPALAEDPVRLGLLTQLKQRLSKDTFTEARIYETIVDNIELVKALYRDFYRHHFVAPEHDAEPYDAGHGEDLATRITRSAPSAIEQQILCAFLSFNRYVLKTNFYRDSKIAMAFRLDPAFLPEVEYPERPFGIFFMLGSEFRGFHVRFRDVARGGVRLIRSGNAQVYAKNNDFLFDEVYQLAHTQQHKNKDIPEGGSKGAILLSLEHQDKGESAFRKYIDSLLDLLLPNEEIQDHLKQQELIFLGPDENTADLMDWASERARQRGYGTWRAFTTGKSVGRGGIPHDAYGMTTRSVHQYVLGILDKLGLKEEAITKLQTGGPDGDLGSNEVKISHDRTIAMVDGSGVVFDPRGLDRAELQRLAEARQMVRHFERSRLGPQGFVVTVDDREVTLPDGSLVENGLLFRNEFHLNPLAAADLFVPCGGRPDAVHINNVQQLLDDRGQARWRFVVEGANLFFTQPARRALERAGVIFFKDAAANKGGVTSSSLEVLAALALDDAQYAACMEVHQRPPQFYLHYTEQVQQRIEAAARAEFEATWREHERSGTPRSIITDQLSVKINQLEDQIAASDLPDHPRLRRRVVAEACPPVLLETVGLEALLERLPDPYVHALIGARLASSYIYRFGLDASELEFFGFVQGYLQ